MCAAAGSVAGFAGGEAIRVDGAVGSASRAGRPGRPRRGHRRRRGRAPCGPGWWWRRPTDPPPRTATAVLAERGITVVPDILANAGGVTASYFEWAQSRQGYAWDEELVATRLARTIDDAFADVWARAQDLGVTMRRAAGVVAVDRLAAAIKARGLFP